MSRRRKRFGLGGKPLQKVTNFSSSNIEEVLFWTSSEKDRIIAWGVNVLFVLIPIRHRLCYYLLVASIIMLSLSSRICVRSSISRLVQSGSAVRWARAMNMHLFLFSPAFTHMKLILHWIDHFLRLQREWILIQLRENGVVDGQWKTTKRRLLRLKRPLKSLWNNSSKWMESLKWIVSFVEDAKISKYVYRK